MPSSAAPASDEPRPALRRDRILAVALALADANGIEAVSMRRVARVLGFEAMSLYTHVTSKDDLLDGILDLVLAEGEVPSATGEWRAAVRGSALSVHRALRRHPWAGPLLMSPSRMRPARLRYMDSLLGRLRGAGFPADSTYHAYHVLDGHIFGFSLWESSHTYSAEQMAGMRDAMSRTVAVEDYPHLSEHGAQHFTAGPLHEMSAFALGLDLILDGLERLRRPT